MFTGPGRTCWSAWDEHADPFTATVRVTIARPRRKLGDSPLIETIVGAGHRLSPHSSPAAGNCG
jgi:DNA-binding response OmpR family regulator